MTLFRWLVLAASVIFAASTFAQQDRGKPEEAAKAPDKAAEKPAAGKPEPVIEISRSSQPNCDVKPVMTDEEIARCRKAWAGSSAGGPR